MSLPVLATASTSPTVRALELAPSAFELVQRLVKTNFVPAPYRGKPEEALACVLTGDMLGLHPIVALREIDVIQGTPAYSAKLQRALVQRAGHRMWLEESTETRCVMAGHRLGDADHVQRVEWTIDRAKRAGLDGRENWRKQPQTMLVARATGELARLIASDELLGLAFNADEVRDGTTDDGDDLGDLTPPPDAPPPPKRTNKRSAATGPQRHPSAHVPPSAALPPLPGEAVDVDVMEPPTERPVDQRRADAVRIRTEARFGRLERDDRLAFWGRVVGHEVASGLELTADDADAILAHLDALEASDVAHYNPPAPEGDDVPNVAEVESWRADDWRAYRAACGLTQVAMLRIAHDTAATAGVNPPPGSVAAIVASPLRFRELLATRMAKGEG
jgi:hypothetical protein